MNSYFVRINNKEYAVKFGQNGTVHLNGHPLAPDVRQHDARTFTIVVDGHSYKIVAERFEDGYRLLLNGKQLEVAVESERTRLLKQFESQSSSGPKKAEIKAPMPALVVKVEVEVGDDVNAGQGLIILEAMKMENEIKTHSAGKVKEIYVTKGKPVEKGELLMLLE